MEGRVHAVTIAGDGPMAQIRRSGAAQDRAMPSHVLQ
jgi:hypothetical protein